MAIFSTAGSKIYIGPAQAADLDLTGYEALDTAGHASGAFVFSANPADGSSIVLNGTTVLFDTTPDPGVKVTIGEDLETTLHYLKVYLDASADTQLVKFTYEVDATTLYLTAVASGSAGNSLTTTASSSPASHATASGATLSGGGSSGWVQIGEVENMGEFGDTASNITFSSIEDARVRKMKGSRDAGQMSLACGFDARDAGQIALRAAQASKFYYAFKVVTSDQRLDTDTPTIFYFNALVESEKTNYGATNNIIKQTFMLAINTEVLEVASAPA